jgi:CDP-diacylglycerol--glycerol-3-phosphate 3-phosphatidyltransferase
MGRADYLRRWSALHGGVAPTGLVGGWLRGVHLLARPLVRLRVPPALITILGGVVAGAAVWVASQGGGWPVAAALLLGVSGVLDNLDGAVAVMTDRVTGWGGLLDSLVDRISDALLLLALWVVGAPPWACLAAAALAYLQEYARARAVAVGVTDTAVVTVSERPVRVAVAAMFLLGAGLYQGAATTWAAAGAVVSLALGVVGCCQLLLVLHRRLVDLP